MKKILVSLLMFLPLALMAQSIVPPEFTVNYRTYQTGPNWSIQVEPSAVQQIQSEGYKVIFNKSAQYTIVATDNLSYGVAAGQMPPRQYQVPPGDEENVFIQINSAGDGFWGRYDPIGQPYP